MTIRKTTALLTLTGLMALAACHGKDEEAPQPANDVIELNNEEQQPPEAPPVIEPEAPANNSVAPRPAPPPPPKVSEDQQMLDDADATGLTSRLPNDPAAGGNHAAAAQ